MTDINYTQKTYKELMDLVERNDSFFFKDFTLEDKTYRIFNYRLASWTLFLEPGALDCRGIMFDVTDTDNVILSSLPPQKFFNYEEGGVEHTKGRIGDKMNKLDGSLISTYLHLGSLYLKSKGSLFSEQANDAMKFLDLEENTRFKEELERLAKEGYTISLEYTAPHNRIVIPYQKEDLTILGARSHANGQNYYATKLLALLKTKEGYTELPNRLVDFISLHGEEIAQLKFVEAIREEKEGEGYVVEIVLSDSESYLTKIKNTKYLALHHTKDSVNSPRRLFESIINEASDDLKSMFADDKYVLDKISEMEQHVQPIYNAIVKSIEDFVKEFKHLERKEFAIKAQAEKPEIMSLLMNGYLGKDLNVKDFAIKRRKEIFGIGDEEPELDEDGNPIRKKSSFVNK